MDADVKTESTRQTAQQSCCRDGGHPVVFMAVSKIKGDNIVQAMQKAKAEFGRCLGRISGGPRQAPRRREWAAAAAAAGNAAMSTRRWPPSRRRNTRPTSRSTKARSKETRAKAEGLGGGIRSAQLPRRPVRPVGRISVDRGRAGGCRSARRQLLAALRRLGLRRGVAFGFAGFPGSISGRNGWRSCWGREPKSARFEPLESSATNGYAAMTAAPIQPDGARHMNKSSLKTSAALSSHPRHHLRSHRRRSPGPPPLRPRPRHRPRRRHADRHRRRVRRLCNPRLWRMPLRRRARPLGLFTAVKVCDVAPTDRPRIAIGATPRPSQRRSQIRPAMSPSGRVSFSSLNPCQRIYFRAQLAEPPPQCCDAASFRLRSGFREFGAAQSYAFQSSAANGCVDAICRRPVACARLDALAAGGAFAVDDSEIGKPGECKVESWLSLASNRDVIAATSPACVIKLGIPLEFGGPVAAFAQRQRLGHQRHAEGQGQYHSGGRPRLRSGLSGGSSWDLIHRRQHPAASSTCRSRFSYARISRSTSMAAGWHDATTKINYATWGGGFEWNFVKPLTLIGEVYGQSGRLQEAEPDAAPSNNSVREPRTQLGLR